MMRSLVVVIICLISTATASRAQMGSSDTGLEISGDYLDISEPEMQLKNNEHLLITGPRYIFSFNHNLSYRNLVYDVSYRTPPLSLTATANLQTSRNSNALFTGIGDAMLHAMWSLDKWDQLHAVLGGVIPLAPLRQHLAQELQPSLGIPSVLSGISVSGKGYREFGYLSMFYQHFMGSNTLGLLKSDNISTVLRLPVTGGGEVMPGGMSSLLGVGIQAEANATYQFTNDRINGTPADGTHGVTLNLGFNIWSPFFINFSETDSPRFDLDYFVSFPVIDHNHVDGTKRTVILGLGLHILFSNTLLFDPGPL